MPFFVFADGGIAAMMGLQVSRDHATGHLGTWRLPGFLIKKLRKTLFVERLASSVDGSVY
jgi:hypothetical protein